MFSSDSKTGPGDQLQQALDLRSQLVERYELSSLHSRTSIESRPHEPPWNL